jgi:hypothetical protein
MPRGKKNVSANAEGATAKKKVAKKKTTRKKATAKKKVTKKTTAKRGRPKGSGKKTQTTPSKIEEQAPQQKSLVSELPVQWILNSGMHFGLINEGFHVGNIFTVDWSNNQMRCEDTGKVYDNIRDLEIAIKLGVAIPHGVSEEDSALTQKREIEKKAQQAKLQSLQNSRKQRDEDVRSMIDHSDRDVVSDINISHTHQDKKIENTPTRKTASSEVSVMRPQATSEMEVHYSDGPQDGQIVRSSNDSPLRPRVGNSSTNAKPLSPVLAGTKVWDATKSGSIESEIRQKMSDYSIKIDDNGQQYIRGLPVVRDDSEASGPSRNEGMTTSLSKEEMADRSKKIQHIRSNKKQEIAQNRAKGGIQVEDSNFVENSNADVASMAPQELIAGMGVSDQGVEEIESTPIPIESVQTPKKKKKSNLAGKLLRRRK